MNPLLTKIREIQKGRGWSDYKLSEESGIGQSTISSWFTKDALPSFTSLEQLAKTFDLTLSGLFADNADVFVPTASQLSMLRRWNMLTDRQKSAVLELCDSFSKDA